MNHYLRNTILAALAAAPLLPLPGNAARRTMNLDGRGYVERAATGLPATGSTALGKGRDNAEWTIGRAGNAGDAADWLRFWGWIDEVRISDIARQPTEFLFAPADRTHHAAH